MCGILFLTLMILGVLAAVGGILYYLLYVRARRRQKTDTASTAGRPAGRIWSTADGDVKHRLVDEDDPTP
jgi:hypothetical protein